MSDTNKTKKKKKIEWTRLLCLFLAILMVAGMAVTGLVLLLGNYAMAADMPEDYDRSDYSFSNSTDGDTYIAVGLMYGSSVTVGFEVKAPFGFVVGETLVTKSDRSFEPFYYIDEQKVSVTLDYNLSKKAMTYSLTDDADATVIGGYHIELAHVFSESFDFENLIYDINNILRDDSIQIIPTYIKGCNRIRLGAYATEAEAESAMASYEGVFESYTMSVVGPSRTAVSVVDPDTDRILFEYDYGEGEMDNLGLAAYQADKNASYIQTPANNNYEGVMMFVPKYKDGATGVSLINLLDLESYVEGVLPYEISNSWNSEVLRAFAITIRSYALANYCKWYGNYGFDLTSTTSDQVYRGRNRVNDAVVSAVESTSGLVTVYNGSICSAYYSSSVGGSTVAVQYVWGSSRGHLQSVETPWEKYADYNNGLWHNEVSPEELCSTLRTKGYTELSGAIESIEIERVSDNTNYVYSAKFTDTNGTSVTIKRSDSVRSVLSSYVKSANFVVAQGSLDFTYNKVYDIKVIGSGGTEKPTQTPDDDTEESISYKGYVTNNQLLISDAQVITSDGEIVSSQYPVAYVLSSTGRKVIMNSNVLTANGGEDMTAFGIKDGRIIYNAPEYAGSEELDEFTEFESSMNSGANDEVAEDTVLETEPVDVEEETPDIPDGENIREVVSDFGDVQVITTLETITETLTASKSGNFIFAGKGWGHGVGISQYGAKDLADAGATAEEILSIYFNDISIVPLDSIN